MATLLAQFVYQMSAMFSYNDWMIACCITTWVVVMHKKQYISDSNELGCVSHHHMGHSSTQ